MLFRSQLEGTEYQLMKLKVEGTPTIAEWLGKELQDVQSPEVGLDEGLQGVLHDKRIIDDRICH